MSAQECMRIFHKQKTSLAQLNDFLEGTTNNPGFSSDTPIDHVHAESLVPPEATGDEWRKKLL